MKSDSLSEDPRSLAEILHDLGEACLCEEAQLPRCLFCEARMQIEAQDRALRLAQADLARWRRLSEQVDPIGHRLRSLPIIGVINVDNPQDPRHKEWKL